MPTGGRLRAAARPRRWTACNDDGIESRDDTTPEPPEAPGQPAARQSRETPDDETAGDDRPGPFDRWRRRSALGAVGTGVALGLQAVFAPPVDEPVIVASVPGDPPGTDDQLRVILDPDDPTKALAIVPEPEPPEPPNTGSPEAQGPRT